MRMTAALLVLALGLYPLGIFARVPAFDAERGVMTAASLLEKVTPAVVSISVQARRQGQDNPLLRDPFFRRFFNVPEQRPERRAMSAGSGVIVDEERGYVMTNHHVIDNAQDITVILKDRREVAAKLIGSDPETDIALLQVDAKGLTSLPFADSNDLRVGDLVFAIGNPFGLGQTVTSGIISALGRGIGMQGYEDFIQTDAPINPGNSGGALVNTKGELVGINTAIIGPSGGNVGIGFAVPTSMANTVMQQLARYGEVRRGRIGVHIQDLTADLAQALGLDGKHGAVISRIERNSPAEDAGLRPADVIIEVDGVAVKDSSQLRNRIGMVERGRRLEIGFYRDGDLKRVTLEVSAHKSDSLAGEESISSLAGAEFTEIPETHPAHGNVDGVLVANLEPGSPAWRSGLRENDIILAVNRRRTSSVEALRDALDGIQGTLAFNLIRGNTQLFIVLR